MRLGTASLLVLLISGCASTPEGEPLEGNPEPLQSESPQGMDEAPVLPVKDRSFKLNACEGVVTELGWPLGGPGESPPGWEFELGAAIMSGRTGSGTAIHVLACSRVSWSHFERPVAILFEDHNRFVTPEDCESDSQNYLGMLNSVWVNDNEFAEFLAKEYQLPVVFANLSKSTDSDGLPMSVTWSWQAPGGMASDLTIRHLGDQKLPSTWTNRYFWDSGSGISYIDFNATWDSVQESSYYSGPDRLVTGTMQEPMLNAQGGRKDYASTYGYLEANLDASGQIKEFGDYECKQAK